MKSAGLGARIFLLVLAIGVVGLAQGLAQAPAQAATPVAATKFIEDLGGRLVPILAGDARSDAEREEQLKVLIRDGFELAITGRFVLGKFWRRANAAQREEYQRLFAQYVVTTAARRFAPFRDITFQIVDSRKVGKKDIMIRTLLIRPDKEVPADWRVRKVGDGYRLIDVQIAGISLALTQRQDFAAVISAEGIDGLLANLRSQVADPGRSAKATTR